MKTYIKPISDIVNVTTDEFMGVDGMSVRIFDGNFSIIDGSELRIEDGSEVLGNEDRVWDSLNNGF